ncbi:hypothetical protein [Treponema sp.]|uniref:hypothetical protein n=1 Tax=Treponema sp. TaxID=166 RepID=UPI00298DEE59|nr:hypothetical protein [Treponema sp.]MCR5613185.1 hypothetical protein [Treponema sp.]
MTTSMKAMYVNKFLRAFTDEFTVKDFIKFMSYVDCPITKEEAQEIVDGSPYLFAYGRGKYRTRAGVFTGQCFSFAITKEECDNQCFVPGHRCIPFVEPDIVSSALSFSWKGKTLKKKNVVFSKEFALEHFSLYGEEYETQYIAGDPGMKDFTLASNDFELPMNVTLNSVDLSPLFEEVYIKPGDRILLRVSDWDLGTLEIEPLIRESSETLELTKDDILRNRWYKNLEKDLLDFFKRVGPCSSIEEQLAGVFFENIDELCTPECGSIEEFLKRTKAVSVELFGVETRLWFTGETVPAIGGWNGEDDYDAGLTHQNLLYSIPDYVLDEYIKDYAWQKRTDMNELISEIFPKTFYIPPKYREQLLLHIVNRNDIILKNYNWFADHQLGDIRHRALDLYTKISALVYEIDRTGGRFGSYPQQELVILIQLYSHLTKLVESFSFDSESIARDTETISASLEGMQFNYEDIELELRHAVFDCKKKDFTVIE